MEQVFLIIVAVIGGLATAVQAQLMGLMDRGIGTLESVGITYMGGALIIGLVLLVLKGGHLGAWQSVPPYALGAGIFGLIIVGSLSYSIPRLGIVPTFTVFVASQFILGGLIDQFGWLGAPVRPLDLSRLLGVPLLLSGTWLIIR